MIDDEEPIPDILLPPKDGNRAPRERVPTTNWKGVLAIIVAVVVAPNLLALASKLPDGAPFVIAICVAITLPLVGVLAGLRMAADIRRGASSSRRLAAAAVIVGLAMTFLMLASLVVLTVLAADTAGP